MCHANSVRNRSADEGEQALGALMRCADSLFSRETVRLSGGLRQLGGARVVHVKNVSTVRVRLQSAMTAVQRRLAHRSNNLFTERGATQVLKPRFTFPPSQMPPFAIALGGRRTPYS